MSCRLRRQGWWKDVPALSAELRADMAGPAGFEPATWGLGVHVVLPAFAAKIPFAGLGDEVLGDNMGRVLPLDDGPRPGRGRTGITTAQCSPAGIRRDVSGAGPWRRGMTKPPFELPWQGADSNRIFRLPGRSTHGHSGFPPCGLVVPSAFATAFLLTPPFRSLRQPSRASCGWQSARSCRTPHRRSLRR